MKPVEAALSLLKNAFAMTDPLVNLQPLQTYLSTLGQAALIDLLLEVAQRDVMLRQSLYLKSAAPSAPVVNEEGNQWSSDLKLAIDEATDIDNLRDWQSDGFCADLLDDMLNQLTESLTAEHAPDQVIRLIQYAIGNVEDMLQCTEDMGDDTEGEMSDELNKIADRLSHLHLHACQLAQPDPLALAADLFTLETTLPMSSGSFGPLTYREVLGEAGLQRYRELAQAVLDALAAKTAPTGLISQAARLTRMLEDVAQARGDIDELVAIKSRDLSSTRNYLAIAEVLQQAGRSDEALAWAERGAAAFQNHSDNRLRDFLATGYLARGRNEEALQLTWVQFAEQPQLQNYQKLHALACQLGVWPEQRLKAQATLKDAMARAANATSRWNSKPPGPDATQLLAIALWEGDLDAALSALNQGRCDVYWRMQLAQQLEPVRPAAAIALYKQEISATIKLTKNSAYVSAIEMISKVGRLMAGLDQRTAFTDYLAQLRREHKIKRNFIKLLDGIKP